MAGNWPILRRDTQYATIHSALVESTGVCGIVVIGDAGVGKTTLARLVTQSLPCPVRWVAGTESARSIPLGVFAHLAGSAMSRDPIGVLAAARETILAEGRSVIGVDDAHLLDQLSATLLHQLALDGSVRIVATVRCGESVPDAITSLWKDGYLQRLHLTAFTKDECVGLIEQALGGRVEGLSSDLMWEASGGNALFVRHLVEGALEAGTLRQVRGVWQLRGRTAVTSELASLLEAKGVTVKYAIHPVAGRMPGHMNVLLAEANVPYDKLYDMEQINPEFEHTDMALVIGANDVVNPAARSDPSSPIYGMPILDVDKAKSVIVLKRSMNPGFAGIENQLFYEPRTSMLFGDAKSSLTRLVSEVKGL